MKADYQDILDLALALDREPRWFDSNGVPRFCAPHPDACSSIYAHEVCFLRVACQHCREEFLVELHTTRMDELLREQKGLPPFSAVETLGYGDPPRHGRTRLGEITCAGGDTMTSVALRVEAFWRRERSPRYEWVRLPELEVELEGFAGIDAEAWW